jgi:uncharacterized protein (TIGR03000 family)
MIRVNVGTIFTLTVGAVMLLAGSSTASAQSTQYDYVIRGMVDGDWYHGRSSGYVAPRYTYRYYPAPTPTYSAYYSAPAPEYIVPRSAALIRLEVPTSADVFFSGEKTKQRGESRSYVTPPLEAGRNYVYRIKVRWKDSNGRVVEREERVSVHPDDRLNLDFQ